MLGKKDEKFEKTGSEREEISAFLGKGTEFDGKLTFEGTVQIDGKFSGEISTQGTLIIGKSAKVQAEIYAKSIVISGEVKGNITTSARLEIHAPGKLMGNIKTPVLVVDEGVIFEGNCQMTSQAGQESREPSMSEEVMPEQDKLDESFSPAESFKIK